MRTGSLRVRIFLVMILLVLASTALPAQAADQSDTLDVKWNKDYTALEFIYLGKSYHYPLDLAKEKFPAQGDPPNVEFKENWPVVTMRARWTISAMGWPAKYRKEAIDLILMYATSAELYEYIYPDQIRSSRYTYPPEFLKDAVDPRYNLAAALRGKEVDYEVVAMGGFGAADYKIKTKIRIGLSQDGQTVFYFDEPEYISDYLKSREFLFAGQDEGDEMHFEIIMFCICQPRKMFRNEAMKRVKNSGEYFVDRLYEKLDQSPTEEDIERFFDLIKNGSQAVGTNEKKDI